MLRNAKGHTENKNISTNENNNQQTQTPTQFSVLMSVYKKEKAENLQKALTSIINQTLQPTEIVIVKDGPLTKELDECIANFNKKHPDIFNILTFKENRGLGLALKDGVKACRYKYIARMDSDDIAHPERFAKQIAYLKQHPQTALLGTWVTEFSKNENKPDTATKLPCTHEEILKFAKKRNPFRHMTVIYQKEAVINSGNYRDFLWFEDYDLWVRMLQKGYKAANIPEYLVNVRADKEMFARRGGWEYLKQDYKFQKFLLKTRFISKNGFLINLVTRGIVRLMPDKTRNYIYKKILRN